MAAIGTSHTGRLGHKHFPHFLRNLAVQPADGVAERRGLHGENRHREVLHGIGAGGCGPAPGRHPDGIPAFPAIGLEMFADQADVETVEPGGHRGVGGEDVVGARGVQRFFEAQTLLRHQNANSLDGQKRRMPFVHVKDGGAEAQRLERAQAADAQHDLLLDALVIVAAVQLVGDLAMLRRAFCGMLLSRRYSFTRPTSIRHTFRNTSTPLRSTLTSSSPLPSAGRFTGVIGSE